MYQIDRIYRHLQKSPITLLQAFRLYGITCLRDIMYNLRKHYDCNIVSEFILVKNRYGKTCRVAKYYLVKQKKVA